MNAWTTRISLAAAGISLILVGCRPDGGLSPGEGYVDVPGGKVWYRIVGSGPATPLLVLHGGPGAPSYYLKPLAALSDERPVVFYDQLGAGHSEAPADTALWRVDRFVRELAQVRKELGLRQVHILGHSWGSMLATEYLLTEPAGVRSLVLASPALSVTRWVRDADSLKATLPDSLQAIIAHHEASGTTESQEYQGAVMEYYRRFLARKQPWSADIDSTFAQFNTDLYGYMWGPSEFAATGTLKDYDRTDRLPELALPVLFTAGRYDEATPATVAYFQRLVAGAELAILEGSAHLTMQDEPEEYVRVIRRFLQRVEQR
ncbi:MAG: proline iminopeptidase-family hydrolase [Gemmatimonadota bacterium]|nr:proline iminopeptidase-family hydrolase [Gemmatimonadota bacterium]